MDDALVGRAFPADVESERALLGQILTDPSMLPEAVRMLEPEDFYRREHGNLFELLTHMMTRREEIDIVTVGERVHRGGLADRYGGLGYVVELPDRVPSASNWRHYLDNVRRKSKLRRLIVLGQSTMKRAADESEAPEELIDDVVRQLSLARGMGTGEAEPETLDEALDLVLDRKQEQWQSKASGGVSTGIVELDDWLGRGMGRRLLHIVAARPSMGKTALALNIVLRVALRNEPAGFVSAEMSREEVVDRVLALYTGIPLSIIINPGSWTQADWDDVVAARARLREVPFLLWACRNPSVADIRRVALRWAMQRGELSVLAVDYLGMLARLRRPEHVAYGEDSMQLRHLAQELNVPLLLIHAVNRQSEGDKTDMVPRMAHLKGSGDIEFHADVVGFVHRPAYYKTGAPMHAAEVHIAKNRQGQCGVAHIEWWGSVQQFCDRQHDPSHVAPGLIVSHTA